MRSTILVMLLLILGAGPGCSDGRAPVFPVQGSVTFSGKPPAGAQVVFHPVGKTGNEAPRPTGQVDADGKFTLTTFKAGDGAPAGDYEVTVEQWVSKNDNPAINLLPARYRATRSSGLHATVAAGENQLATFKLAR
jgi:hypothetical protein